MSIWDWFRRKGEPTGPTRPLPERAAALEEQARRNADADRRDLEDLRRIAAQEREAEQALAPCERIKKHLNLPSALPAGYKADESIPWLAPARPIDGVPMVTVVNRVGIGVQIPQVLFDYLYRDRSLTADDKRVITESCLQWGFDPGPI
jgi:hypothetical protein